MNWIPVEEEYCDVCKLELHMETDLILLDDDDQEDGQYLCPICKLNYILEDEDMCSSCKAEQLEKEETHPLIEEEETEWTEIFDEPVEEEDEDSISIVDIEGEEEEAEEEDKWDDANPDDEKFPDDDDEESDDLDELEDDDLDEEEDDDEDEEDEKDE